jgi:hypothetical protein
MSAAAVATAAAVKSAAPAARVAAAAETTAAATRSTTSAAAEATGSAATVTASAASISTSARGITAASAVAATTVTYTTTTVAATSTVATTTAAIESMTPAPTATVPRPGAKEEAAIKPVRSVVAIRSACIRSVAVVAVVADRRSVIVPVPAATNADTHRNLGLSLLPRRKRQTHSNYRQECKIPYFEEPRKKLHVTLLSGPNRPDPRTTRCVPRVLLS